jgi:hypothetical protein
MQVKKVTYIDDETGEVVLEKHWCGDSEISSEEYDKILGENDEMDELEDDEMDCCNCEECDGCDDEDLDDLVHKTVENIIDTKGCPYCIEEELWSFYDSVVEKILDALDN